MLSHNLTMVVIPGITPSTICKLSRAEPVEPRPCTALDKAMQAPGGGGGGGGVHPSLCCCMTLGSGFEV